VVHPIQTLKISLESPPHSPDYAEDYDLFLDADTIFGLTKISYMIFFANISYLNTVAQNTPDA